MTVWVYVDTSKQVGDKDHLNVFASEETAETWFEENDPEGVAFEYEVLEWTASGRRTIMCMMLIAALAIIWNSLGHWTPWCVPYVHMRRDVRCCDWKRWSPVAFARTDASPALLLFHLENVDGESSRCNRALPVGPKAIHLIALDTENGHQWPSWPQPNKIATS
jgi:hypothetical protein